MQIAILTVDKKGLEISIHVEDAEVAHNFKQVAHLPYSGEQYEYCKEWLGKHGYEFYVTLDVANVSQWIYTKHL